MTGWDMPIELALLGLLALTLAQAIRLERMLASLRRDRPAFTQAAAEFELSAKAAEASLAQVNADASASTQQLAQLIQDAAELRSDLVQLTQRGSGVADRLDRAIRSERDGSQHPAIPAARVVSAVTADGADPAPVPRPKLRSQAERDLLLALRSAQ